MEPGFPKIAAFVTRERLGAPGKELQAYFPADPEVGRKKDLILRPHKASPVGHVREGVHYDISFYRQIGTSRERPIILVMVLRETNADSPMVPPRLQPNPWRERGSYLPPQEDLLRRRQPLVVLDRSDLRRVHFRPSARARPNIF